MEAWECSECGYIYDPQEGDEENGIDPGTDFEDIDDDWQCPECGADRDVFERVNV